MKTYHGSNQIITTLDLSFQKSGFYQGFYSTTDIERAKEFGSYLYEFTLAGEYFEILNAEHGEKLTKESGHSGSGMNVVKLLKDQGYSGIKRGNEYITFDPKTISFLQIK